MYFKKMWRNDNVIYLNIIFVKLGLCGKIATVPKVQEVPGTVPTVPNFRNVPCDLA